MKKSVVLALALGLLIFVPDAAGSEPLKVRPSNQLNFGNLPVGVTTSEAVTITNASSEPVFIAGLGVSGNSGSFLFEFGTQTCLGFLQPQASCRYTILFRPTGRGRLTGTSDISGGNRTQFIRLVGRGT